MASAYAHEKPECVKRPQGRGTAAGGGLELPSTASHKGRAATGGADLSSDMPTLFRFLVTIGILAGIVYGAMFALVTFVEPKKGEITVRVPLDKLGAKP
jgi:hypothetical protein